jgi:hypothetical protein
MIKFILFYSILSVSMSSQINPRVYSEARRMLISSEHAFVAKF